MRTDYFDVEALFNSVGEFRQSIVSRGDKPSAEKWTANSHYRNEMFMAVRSLYCKRTKCKPWNFPFSVDGVVNAFLRFRKERKPDVKPDRIDLFPPL